MSWWSFAVYWACQAFLQFFCCWILIHVFVQAEFSNQVECAIPFCKILQMKSSLFGAPEASGSCYPRRNRCWALDRNYRWGSCACQLHKGFGIFVSLCISVFPGTLYTGRMSLLWERGSSRRRALASPKITRYHEHLNHRNAQKCVQ